MDFEKRHKLEQLYCEIAQIKFALSPKAWQEKKPAAKQAAGRVVGVDGFEPTASCSQSKRASQLRYTPWRTQASR